MENLLDEKFPAGGLEDVLEQYGGEARASEALVEVLVTSDDIERRRPFFKRRDARPKPGHAWLMRQAARATADAPTYFEPARPEVEGGGDHFALIDGGVFADNPARCAYAEARALWPQETDFLVVSRGTGEPTRSIPYEEARSRGLAKWAQPILGVVFDGVSDTVDYQVQDLCRDQVTRVSACYRFQATLTHGNDDMDDASATNIRALRLLAESLLDQREGDLEDRCGQP